MSEAPSLDLRYEDVKPLRANNGMEIYHEIRGDQGPTLTFINNFYLIAPMWRTFAPTLPERNRVLTYDLRNLGATTGGFTKVAWQDHLDDLLALLDGLGIESTYLVATSASTLIARDFAIAHPDRVKGLVLQGPAFSPYGGRKRRAITRSWINTLKHAGTAPLWDQLYSKVFSDAAMEQGGTPLYLGLREAFTSIHSVAALQANLESSLEPSDEPELLTKIPCPTLLVVGENDFLWSRSSVELAESLLPQNQTVFLPVVGHLPFLEASAEVEKAIQAFVDGVEVAS